ncbi:MAG: DUF1134 domain-containing protein [Hyphomicrobiaceae bacterium]|nr:DUF1134 domain-containing protein [Hyphomicrobiaceae bacterium]
MVLVGWAQFTASAVRADGLGPEAVAPIVVAQSDAYRPDRNGRYEQGDDAYRPAPDGRSQGYGAGSAYNSGPDAGGSRRYDEPDGSYRGREAPPSGAYGEPYAPPSGDYRRDRDRAGIDRYEDRYDERKTYSQSEIVEAGHGFFGSISQGLANVIEHAFKKAGRPNGYILGEDAGGAFVAGLRYGEGRLYTKNAGDHKVYWQGPSVGYDFGGAGAKTMVLVYNLRDPSDIYHRFAGVEGTAYLVGGVSLQFQKYGDVTMAPIRAGVGLRLGANIGYLKYTRRPTWNPF